MTKPIVFMFSGQGSQYYQMGKELFNHHPLFRKWMLKLDAYFSRIIRESVLDHLYDKENSISKVFDCIYYTHPAIFMIEYSLYQVLLDMGIEPDYVLGVSMGGFCSAAIARVMRLEEIIEAVCEQAVFVENNFEKGKMLAILAQPDLYYEIPLIYDNSELAAINFHSHFVISGSIDKLQNIELFLKEKEINFQILPVNQPFHSSLMDFMSECYIAHLEQKSYSAPQIPFISCAFAQRLKILGKSHFWEMVRRKIEFKRTIQLLEQEQNYIYLDLSPSGTLATFVKYNLSKNSDSVSFSMLTPFGTDLNNLRKIKEYFERGAK